MSNEPQDIRITVSNVDGDIMSLTLPWDAALEHMTDTFRTILFWLTYAPATIDNYIPNPAREWGYADEDTPRDDEH